MNNLDYALLDKEYLKKIRQAYSSGKPIDHKNLGNLISLAEWNNMNLIEVLSEFKN